MPLGTTAKEKGSRLKGDPKTENILKMFRFKVIFKIGKIRVVISNY